MARSNVQPLRKIISSPKACGCAPMNPTRQPSPTPNAKTRVSPSVPQSQRRPRQGTCQRPEVSEPPNPPVSETRMKSEDFNGKTRQMRHE
eukprot:3688537-Lingulodinium_polyedra.AAC.1